MEFKALLAELEAQHDKEVQLLCEELDRLRAPVPWAPQRLAPRSPQTAPGTKTNERMKPSPSAKSKVPTLVLKPPDLTHESPELSGPPSATRPIMEAKQQDHFVSSSNLASSRELVSMVCQEVARHLSSLRSAAEEVAMPLPPVVKDGEDLFRSTVMSNAKMSRADGSVGSASGDLPVCRLRSGPPVYELCVEWSENQRQGSYSGAMMNANTMDFSDDVLLTGRSKAFHRTTWRRAGSPVMHPSSPPRVFWDICSMFVIAIDTLMTPLHLVGIPKSVVVSLCDWTSRLFWTIDIGASFTVGYYYRGEVVMDQSKVIHKYIKTWLAFDLGLVLLDWITMSSNDGKEDSSASGLSVARFIRGLRIVRLARVVKMKKVLLLIEDMISTRTLAVYVELLFQVFFITAICHLIACLWFGMGLSTGWTWLEANDLRKADFDYIYFSCLHWALSQFVLGGLEIEPVNAGERIFAVSLCLAAMVMFSALIGKVSNSIATIEQQGEDEVRDMWLLLRYLRDHGVSRDLVVRIRRHVEYTSKSRRKRLQEDEISMLRYLSERLQAELRWELHVSSLAGHPMFRKLASQLRSICLNICSTSVREMECSCADMLFHAGEDAIQVVFIPEGGVQYNRRGETSEVKAKTWVAEAALWTQWKHRGDLLTCEECKVILLNVASCREEFVRHEAARQLAVDYGSRFLQIINGLGESLTDLPMSETLCGTSIT